MEGSFTVNAKWPLECARGSLAVLVDEASMLDITLAAALLDALPTDRPVQLVLVGALLRCPLYMHLHWFCPAVCNGLSLVSCRLSMWRLICWKHHATLA